MLRHVNTALEAQIDDTRRGQGELRQLSAALESGSPNATAELHETIVELETFNYSVSHDCAVRWAPSSTSPRSCRKTTATSSTPRPRITWRASSAPPRRRCR